MSDRRPALSHWLLLGALLLGFVLVPFALLDAPMQSLSDRWLQPGRAGLLGVGLAVVLLHAVDVILPVPSSLVSTASGYLLGIPAGAAASFIGMTAGCLIGYFIGARAGKTLGRRIVTPEQLAQLELLAQRAGPWVLAAARPVPVLAEVSVILAGVSRLPCGRFLAITSLANLGISVVYASAGGLSATVGSFALALGAALLLPLGFMSLRRYWTSAPGPGLRGIQ